MSDADHAGFYRGRGARPANPSVLPTIDPTRLRAPEGYRASRELAAAVDVAITLGMPLLLTGEPGCGKSRLAHSIAWELRLGDPLTFVVKSDTEARDLFYEVDAVARFHAAQSKDADTDPRRFLSFNALGQAMLHALPAATWKQELGAYVARFDLPDRQSRKVVLIDEIDKAPRDVPNDLLSELDDLSFQLRELEAFDNKPHKIGLATDENEFRPIVILTSNSEKALPDAFLRRCIYYHVPFPPFLEYDDKGALKTGADTSAVSVQDIVASRVGTRYEDAPGFVASAVRLFRHVRGTPGLERAPSLAELLNWLDLLLPVEGRGAALPLHVALHARLPVSIKTVLLKKENDQARADELIVSFEKEERVTRRLK